MKREEISRGRENKVCSSLLEMLPISLKPAPGSYLAPFYQKKWGKKNTRKQWSSGAGIILPISFWQA